MYIKKQNIKHRIKFWWDDTLTHTLFYPQKVVLSWRMQYNTYDYFYDEYGEKIGFSNVLEANEFIEKNLLDINK